MKNAFDYIYMFFYFHYWLCYEVLQKIIYRGHFYVVATIENGLDITIKPMLHESFVEEKAEYIRSLANKLPQEECIAEALKEALYAFLFLIFLVPGKDSQYVQFLFNYAKPGNPFILEINSLNTNEDRGRIKKVTTLLQSIHYYPHTVDRTILHTYGDDFAGFFHHEMEGEIECIHMFYKKTQIKDAAHMTSFLMRKIFKYKGRVEIIVGDALDEYRHND